MATRFSYGLLSSRNGKFEVMDRLRSSMSQKHARILPAVPRSYDLHAVHGIAGPRRAWLRLGVHRVSFPCAGGGVRAVAATVRTSPRHEAHSDTQVHVF